MNNYFLEVVENQLEKFDAQFSSTLSLLFWAD